MSVLLQPHFQSFSELYVVECDLGQGSESSPVEAMVRVWRHGAPMAYQPLKDLELFGKQTVPFSVAAGSPDAPMPAGQDLPSGWRPLGLSLQGLALKGWKAYLGSNVLTLSYGRDLFFSVDLAKGSENAKDLIKLAFAQMPPKSQRVYVFDASDLNLSGQGWLVPVLQELGLSVRPLKLAQPFFLIPWQFFSTAPRGLLSGLFVLSLLLVVQILWKPLDVWNSSARVVDSRAAKDVSQVSLSANGVTQFLHQVAQALLASGTFEVGRIRLQSIEGEGERQLEFDLVSLDLATPLNREILIKQLKQIPGIIEVVQKDGSKSSFVARVGPQVVLSSSPKTQGKAVRPLSFNELSSRLSDYSRRVALVVADPKKTPTGWRIEAIQQPSVSAIRFIDSLPADVLSDDSLKSIEIQRSGVAGLVSLFIEITL